MIAAGRGDDARGRNRAEQIGESAARLEGTRVLQQFELEDQTARQANSAQSSSTMGVRRT